MKLVYFWVEEHLCLKNQGFHFTNRYNFSFEKDEKGYCLEIDKSKDDTDVKLFFDAPLSDLRIFVGENGRGKTILFKLIESLILRLENYKPRDAMNYSPRCLMVFEKENNELLYWNFGIGEMRCEEKSEINIKEETNGRSINKCFFYNVEDKKQDIEMQMAFICKDKLSDWLPFPVPKYLKINFEREELLFSLIFKKLNDLKKETNYEERAYCYRAQIDDYKSKIKEKLEETGLSSIEQEFFRVICWTVFYELTKSISWRMEVVAEDTCKEVENFQREFCEKMNTSNEWSALDEILTSMSQVTHLNEFIKLLRPEVQEAGNQGIILKLHSSDNHEIDVAMVNKLTSIYQAYYRVYETMPFHIMDFLWELSSGEYALLNTFAHIYDASKKCSNEDSDFLIFLDEIDLSLHPRWQQQYMDFLTHMLRECFHDKQIQLVLATHSPIILSDIYNQFVTYLKPKDNTIYSLVSENEKHMTYGANIFDIYKDAFYLTKTNFGFIGAAAAEKIHAVLEDLKTIKCALESKSQGYITKEDLENGNKKLDDCIKIINMIDDPILQGLLRERVLDIRKILFKKKELIMLLESLSESELQQVQNYIKKKESN